MKATVLLDLLDAIDCYEGKRGADEPSAVDIATWASRNEADRDIAAGRTTVHANADAMFAHLAQQQGAESLDWARHTFAACAESWPEWDA